MLFSELQNLPRPCWRFADRLVAKRRQAPAESRRDQVEVIVAKARSVAKPHGVDLSDHFLDRLGDLHAWKRLGELRRNLWVGVVVASDLRIGKRELVKGEFRIADVLAEKLC